MRPHQPPPNPRRVAGCPVGNSAEKHTCHAEGCSAIVPPRLFGCRKHWAMVPKWLQAALYRVYVPGQEIRKNPTRAYLMVQTRCRLAIAEKEGKPAELITGLRSELRLRILANFSGEHREIAGSLDLNELLRATDEGLGAPRAAATPGEGGGRSP